ncbi:hypothetical protein HU200_017907 [Digitaria exilis]|uniref:Uncharacterized protein n=1 Tax=Digitaria exilis TaxID=1010633 RepID=A0A835KGC2_9POAL|nr:hypothetical protein HU200_017907 [Digitaria exilis]
MAKSTTPPETMLRRKFLSDGEIPGDAASATSGSTSAAATAAAAAHSFPGCCWPFCADARTTTAEAALRGETRSDDALLLPPAQRGFPSPRATDRDAATAVAAMDPELSALCSRASRDWVGVGACV